MQRTHSTARTQRTHTAVHVQRARAMHICRAQAVRTPPQALARATNASEAEAHHRRPRRRRHYRRHYRRYNHRLHLKFPQ